MVGKQEEGRLVMKSVVKCLEGNMHGSECVRELCLVVGPGVLRSSGDATKVQSLCSAHKTGLSVVYQGAFIFSFA